MTLNLTYGIGGYIPGEPNSPEVQAAYPDLAAENVVEVREVADEEYVETRPECVHTDPNGRPAPSIFKYRSQKRWTTFVLHGDGTEDVFFSCPDAECWNTKCASITPAPIPDGLSEAETRAALADGVVAVTLVVAGHEQAGCPRHAQVAEPSAHDLLVDSLTDEEIAAAVARATSGA